MLDTAAVVDAAVEIVHEANVRNRAGAEDNLCKCGHKPQAHILGNKSTTAGCMRCEAEHPGHKNYCTGYRWEPRVPLPMVVDPEPVATGDAMPRCDCGHLILEHSGPNLYNVMCHAQHCPCNNFHQSDPGNWKGLADVDNSDLHEEYPDDGC